MAKTLETIINRFDGGLVNDPRIRVSNSCTLCKNFDTATNPNKLTPYRDSESGDNNASTSQKQNFALGLWTASTPDVYKIFGLGVVSGQNYAEINMKDITTSSNDLSDGGWSAPANNASASGDTSFNLFTYYAKTGKIYGARAGTHIWAFTPDGSTAFDDTSNPLTYTTIGEGLVHSKDDILYVPYFYDGGGVAGSVVSAIAKFDGSTWTNTAITFPKHLKPTSICEYGNYIAVGMTPVNGIGKTFVYLWNRDSSLTTLSESIEWGTGEIKVLEEVEGYLVGISLYGNSSTRITDRIIFRYYAGGSPKTFLTLQGDDTQAVTLLGGKQKIDERLYFMMDITKDSVAREGVWSLFLANNQFRVVHERTPNNDTELTDGQLKGFIKVGDYVFQSYVDNGTFGLSKTTGEGQTSTYSHSAVYQTNINPNMGEQYLSTKKQLVGVSLSHVALPSTSNIKLEYRVDGGSWVEIFTKKADSAGSTAEQANVGSVITEAKVDVNGDSFQEGYEYEFRLTSGGVTVTERGEITELKYKVELMGTVI